MELSFSNSAWVWFALSSSLFAVIGALIAEYFPGRILKLLFFKRIFAVLAYAPVVFLLPWPGDPVFYVAIIIGSVAFCYADLIVLGLIKKSGAGVVMRIAPLSGWALFFFWTAISPALFFEYVQNPLRSLGIIVSLTACVYFALRLRRCDISWPVVKRIMPAIISIVLGVSLSKIAMDHSNFHAGIWYYGFIQSLCMMVFFGLLFRFPHVPTLRDLDIQDAVPRNFFEPRALLFALGAALGLVIAQPLRYYAITMVENPAYAQMFELLIPFWILCIYKLIGRKEDADILSGLGIVVSTGMLVVFTQF